MPRWWAIPRVSSLAAWSPSPILVTSPMHSRSRPSLWRWRLRRPEEAQEEQPPTLRQRAQAYLDTMTLEEKVGQMFFARRPKKDAPQDAAEYALGGYLLFTRDIQDPDAGGDGPGSGRLPAGGLHPPVHWGG